MFMLIKSNIKENYGGKCNTKNRRKKKFNHRGHRESTAFTEKLIIPQIQCKIARNILKIHFFR